MKFEWKYSNFLLRKCICKCRLQIVSHFLKCQSVNQPMYTVWRITYAQGFANIMLYILNNYMIVVKTLRPRQNGRHFPDDIFKWIFFNENVWISINISLKFVPRGPINNMPTLVQVMAWRRPGDKPLSEPMMVRFFQSSFISTGAVMWIICFPQCQSGTP